MTSLPIWVTLGSALFILPVAAFAQGLAINPVEDAREIITSTVTGMTQDRLGFLWLGTANGLFRYDGRTFQAYHHERDVNSLTVDNIEHVAMDSAGYVWIATFSHGLDRLDPTTGIFTHYGHDRKDPNSLACDTVASMLTDHTGTLWVATFNGLDRLDKGSTKFIHYVHDPDDSNSISCNNVRALYEDKDSVLWVGTGNVFMQGEKKYKTLGGLNRFDRKTGKFTRYLNDLKNEHSLIDNRVTTLFEDSQGTFWVGTANDGLQTLDRKTGSFTRHRFDPSRPGKLSRPPLKPPIFNWAEDFIPIITESFDGKIIIGTFANGINVYDRVTQKTLWYAPDPSATVKLADNYFWKTYTSRDKSVWISAWGGNLYRVTRDANPYTHHKADSVVISILEDEDETLWIGSLHGLVKQEKTGSRTRYLIDSSFQTPFSNLVFPLRLDGSVLTLQSSFGLYKFDIHTSAMVRYLHREPGNVNSMLSDTISSMVKTKDGDLFFSTPGGLNVLDHNTKIIRGFTHEPGDTTSISHNEVYFVALDHYDNVWTGGREGVCRFDKATGKFRRYHTGETAHLMNDSKGTLWAAGIKGLFSYNEQKDAFVRFRDPYRVIPAAISGGCILEDKQGNLWLGSSWGIVQIPADSNMESVMRIWDRDMDPTTLTLGLVRRNGNILFGSISGYYEIVPTDFKKAKINHRVLIERFLLNDIPVLPVNGGILTQPLDSTREILLSHDQNTFAFELTDIDLSSIKGKTHITCKLEGYDRTWRNVSTSKSAQYFNVEPGTYNFIVKSFDIYGNASEASLMVTIAPPWWKTSWAYIGFAVAAFGTVGAIYFARVSVLRRQQAAQIRVMVAIQEDERKRISRDLHDEVGTKLSALKLFISSLREKVSVHGDTEVEALAKTSEQFIGEAMADVRTLLANLSPSVLEEFGYTVAVEGLINKLNETRQASFKLSVFGMERRLKPAYELALYRITQELINNVMKHAAAHCVSLQIGQRNERIVLMIEDDGKGFDINVNTGGYGLKNLAARCKLMQGSMTIDSRPGMGTSVVIEIPYDNPDI